MSTEIKKKMTPPEIDDTPINSDGLPAVAATTHLELEEHDQKLFVDVEGKVISSNLLHVEQAVKKYLENLKTDLETDDDFYFASQCIKKLKSVEDNITEVKKRALQEMKGVNYAFSKMDDMKGGVRERRLFYNRLVTDRKTVIRKDLIEKYKEKLNDYVLGHTQSNKLNFNDYTADGAFQEVIKGKVSQSSIQEALDQRLIAVKKIVDRDFESTSYNLAIINKSLYPYLFQDKSLLFKRLPELEKIIKEREERETKRIQEEADKKKREEAAQKEREEAHRKQREREQERKAAEPSEQVQEEEISKPAGGQGYEVRADDKVIITSDKEKVERYIDSIELPEFPELKYQDYIPIKKATEKTLESMKQFLKGKAHRIGETK